MKILLLHFLFLFPFHFLKLKLPLLLFLLGFPFCSPSSMHCLHSPCINYHGSTEFYSHFDFIIILSLSPPLFMVKVRRNERKVEGEWLIKISLVEIWNLKIIKKEEFLKTCMIIKIRNCRWRFLVLALADLCFCVWIRFQWLLFWYLWFETRFSDSLRNGLMDFPCT